MLSRITLSSIKRNIWIILLILIVGVVALPPILWVIYGSFTSGSPMKPTGFTLEGYLTYTDPFVHRAIFNSFTIAVAKTLVALPIAFLLAWITTRTDVPGKGIVETLIPAALLMPGFIAALVWILILSPSIGILNARILPIIGLEGVVFNIYSYWGVVWVQSTLTVPYAYLIFAAALSNIDPSYEESARIAGGRTFYVLRTVTLPLIKPALLSFLILSIILGIEAFDIPLLIGGPAGIPVITTEIYRGAHFFPPDYTSASSLAILLLVTALILVTLQRSLVSQTQRFATITGRGYRPALIKLSKPWRYIATFFMWFLLVIYVFLPIITLFIVAVFRGYPFSTLEDFTLHRFVRMWDYPMIERAFMNTFITAVYASIVATILALFVAYCVARTNLRMRSLLENFATLPLAVPPIVLSLGFFWAYVKSPLWGTVWVLTLAFIARGLPWGLRATIGSMVQIDKGLEESSRICGAGWLQTFLKIVFRLISSAVIASLMLVIILTIRELALPSLLYASGSEFLSVLLLEMWNNGFLGETAALSFVLIICVTFLSIVLRKILKTSFFS